MKYISLFSQMRDIKIKDINRDYVKWEYQLRIIIAIAGAPEQARQTRQLPVQYLASYLKQKTHSPFAVWHTYVNESHVANLMLVILL